MMENRVRCLVIEDEVETSNYICKGLREAGRSDIKVIAGGVIPPQDYDFLRDAGVQGIYGPGSNVVECAADVLRLLGHNMPPVGE